MQRSPGARLYQLAEANQRARDYFTRPHGDLARVCYVAGLDPDAVREAVLRALAQPTPTTPKATARRGGPKLLAAFGRQLTLSEWAETGIAAGTISSRVHSLDWSLERALSEPTIARSDRVRAAHREARPSGRAPGTFTHDGQTMTLREWAHATGIHRATLSRRLYTLGWPLERVLTEPLKRPAPRRYENTRKEEGRPEERPSILLPGGLSLTHPINAKLSLVGFTYMTAGGSPNAIVSDRGVASDFAPVLGTGGGPNEQETQEIALEAQACP